MRLLIHFFFFILCFGANAQQFNFRNFNVEDGLGQSQVYALCQDKSGALWFGTRGGGITIYDGVEFRTLTTKDGLANNYINCIKLGPDSTIWIGTNNGISYVKNNVVKSIKLDQAVVVRNMVFREDGTLLAASDLGILILDKTSIQFENKNQEDKPSVNALIEHKGKIWFGTNDGLYRREKDKDVYLGDQSSYMRNAITSITKDKKGQLWIGTYGDGMYCYNANMFYRIDLQHELYRETVLDVYVDANNNLWIATLRSGVIHYDRATRTFSNIGEAQGLSNNHVRCITQDNTKQFWFGTSGGGVCQFLGKQFATFDTRSGLAGNFIYSVFRDSKGRVWVGNSQKGVSLYQNGRFENFNAGNQFLDVKVKSINEDRDGTIWFGTDGNGVYIYKNEKFLPIEALRGSYVKQLKSDKNGAIWIATAGSGIIRVEPTENNYVVEKWGYSDGLLSSRITTLHFDKKGRLWYGSEGNGVGCFDPKIEKNILKFTADKDGILASNLIRTIEEDNFGRLWVGTADACLSVIRMYEPQKNPWNVGQNEGLRSNNIYVLIRDQDGNIISGTEKGIDYIFFREGGEIEQIKSYGNQDGFSGVETCQNSAWLDKSGQIWIGTINGLCQFNPAEMQGNKVAPKLAFKDIKLFYESILKQTPNALNQGTAQNPLLLSYSENHITFEFLGINLKRPDGVQYRWKLAGFDNKWSPASKDRSIVYSNLNPGKYTFQLIASNEDGVWSEPISYTFVIETPYWKTTWFKLMIGFLILLILIFAYFISMRRIRKNARIKQREVEFEMDLLELEQKAMRLQMNPHFIFNALNSIQSLIGTGKEVEARYFLAKFSRLMRQILDNSRKASITLEEEINTLENYLLIEQFCNGNRFSYEVIYDSKLEPDFIQLPPMIIQPFVENAIKHGMRGIPEGTSTGKISIRFLEENSFLKIEVEDNGIGREKAAELNRGSKETYHQSTALVVTTERLQLMKSQGVEVPLEILDLYENGVASGTKIIIRIPLN